MEKEKKVDGFRGCLTTSASGMRLGGMGKLRWAVTAVVLGACAATQREQGAEREVETASGRLEIAWETQVELPKGTRGFDSDAGSSRSVTSMAMAFLDLVLVACGAVRDALGPGRLGGRGGLGSGWERCSRRRRPSNGLRRSGTCFRPAWRHFRSAAS
jgi:hypothetical protein